MRLRWSFSLIEVVASVVLIGGTLTSLLTAQADSLKQLQATKASHIGADLAHELIASWRLDPPTPGAPRSGPFADHAGWSWTRSVRPMTAAHGTRLLEITLRIHRVNNDGTRRRIVQYTWLERPDVAE